MFAMVFKIVQINLMKRGVSLNADLVASTIFNVKMVNAILIKLCRKEKQSGGAVD